MDKESGTKLIDDVFDKLFAELDALKKDAIAKLEEPLPTKYKTNTVGSSGVKTNVPFMEQKEEK